MRSLIGFLVVFAGVALAETQPATELELRQKHGLLATSEAVASIERKTAYEDEHLTYRLASLKHRTSVLEQQMIQTWVIFITVMLMVLSGLYLAWRQFRLDEETQRARCEKVASSEAGDAPGRTTSLEISPDGIKIQSSVIGLIVLALSFAFFYLYIVHVYTVTEVASAGGG